MIERHEISSSNVNMIKILYQGHVDLPLEWFQNFLVIFYQTKPETWYKKEEKNILKKILHVEAFLKKESQNLYYNLIC